MCRSWETQFVSKAGVVEGVGTAGYLPRRGRRLASRSRAPAPFVCAEQCRRERSSDD